MKQRIYRPGGRGEPRLDSLSPTRMIALGFCALVLVGTGLLMLPVSTREGSTGFLDALFTAASAVCVTGLVRFDTYTHWSLFGQLVILLMIQVGGLGFVTIALSFMMVAGRKISLNQRILMQESVAAPQMGGVVRLLRFIMGGSLCLEAAGTALLAFYFCPKLGVLRGLYFSVFHAVSAFCNAGFDLMGIIRPGSSLCTAAGNLYLNLVIMLLIILGGLGFFVWSDLWRKRFRFRDLALHTKVALSVTGLLILSGALLIFGFELGGTLFQGRPWGERALCSLFQSVTARTAGFNTVDLAALNSRSKTVMILLMLVGGSPGSTAGGMKTTTFAILLCTVYATFRRRRSVELFHRRVEEDVLRTAVSIAVFYLGLSVAAALAVSAIEGVSLMAALFETVSAIATVGSSLGLTAALGPVSEVILIFLMLVGRIGSVTFLLAFTSIARAPVSQYPAEKIQVG